MLLLPCIKRCLPKKVYVEDPYNTPGEGGIRKMVDLLLVQVVQVPGPYWVLQPQPPSISLF